MWLGGKEREGNKTSEGAVKVYRKSNGNLSFALRLNQILCFSGPDSSQLRWKKAISVCQSDDSTNNFPSSLTYSYSSTLPGKSSIIVESDATISCILRAKSCLYLISNLESPIPDIWQRTCLKSFALKLVLFFCFLKNVTALSRF